MARIKGANNYTKDQVNFIKNNWLDMSDEKLSIETGIPISSVQRCRTRYGLKRYRYSIRDNATKAFICEMFVSDMPIKEICGIVGKSNYLVTHALTAYFGKTLNDDRFILTLPSKV